VLRAARRTLRYRGVLEAAGLATDEQLARIHSIEEALPRVPRLEVVDLRTIREGLRVPDSAQPSPGRLFYPAGPTPRTAVVLPGKLPWFDQSGGVKVFEPEDTAGLRKYAPEAIAAPSGYLVFLARMVDAGYFAAFPKPRHALIAFTGMVSRGGAPSILTPMERDILWQVFRIPVFEQYLGMDGRLVAWECQAHEALHIVPENAVFEKERLTELLFTSLTNCYTPTLRLTTKASGNIESARCPCGHSSPLLSGLRTLLAPVPPRTATA